MPDYFTKKASDHLAKIRAEVAEFVPAYAWEHDRNVKFLERMASKYRFKFDLATPAD